MEWNVWVIKPYGITNRQLSNGSYVVEVNISAKYFAEILTSLSWDCAVLHSSCTTVFLNATWGFVCETGLCAVSESNTRNRKGFRQRRGEILRIWRHVGQRVATPTFAAVFHFTASKPRFFWALCKPKLFCGLPHKKITCKISFHLFSMQTVKASTAM
jgi:hypothetical protein